MSILKFLHKNEKSYSDDELISRYKVSGKQEYVAELYTRHSPLLLGVCLKYISNKQLAEDCVAELFEVLGKDLLKYEVKNFRSWLYMVTRNYCYRKINKEKTLLLNIASEINDSVFMESDDLIYHSIEDTNEQQFNALEYCMKTLKPEQQACVDLFYIKEKSYKEIVEATEYELKKVKSYIQNGKRNLKNCIEEQTKA